VTVADREAEQRAVAVLRDAFPEYGVLGEEYGEQSGRGARWIIDPIDGTKSFIRGIPFFATLVALEEDGEITTGAVYAPAMGDLLYAQKGQGAFDQNGPLRVSTIDTVRRSMLVFGGAGLLRIRGYWPAFERLVDNSGRQRAYGDYFGYTFIARGQAEAMIDVDLQPWDLAALKIIIEEAGGRFTDFGGRATAFGGSAIASNGLVHDEIRRLIDAV
jgi:histidinol phosphatase-like enzyme (inositol monophosphatase family)